MRGELREKKENRIFSADLEIWKDLKQLIKNKKAALAAGEKGDEKLSASAIIREKAKKFIKSKNPELPELDQKAKKKTCGVMIEDSLWIDLQIKLLRQIREGKISSTVDLSNLFSCFASQYIDENREQLKGGG